LTRLFHVSDLHFGAEDKAALDWFARTVRAEWPDAVIITGDLTMRARAREFAAAAAWLRDLGRPVSIEVGNHDLPYFNPWARFVTPYARYSRLEAALERPLASRDVTIVPLRTTARFQWRLNWSKGVVPEHRLARTLDTIAAAPTGAMVIVACHHPLIETGTRGTSRTRRGAAALDALAAAGAEAVLSGHVHDPFDVPYKAGGRTIRMIGAGTLSRRVRETPASFNELTIAGGRLNVRQRVMA